VVSGTGAAGLGDPSGFAISSFDLSGLGILVAQGDQLTFRMSVDACPQGTFCHGVMKQLAHDDGRRHVQ
jgi:hypothetical protein